MLVRFWGTRGSLPSPLDAEAVRAKVIAALLAADGRRFESGHEVGRYLDDECDFPLRGTYGGETSCVEIESGADEFVICDMGSGLRRFGIDSLRRTAAGQKKIYNFFLSHFHWDHIMGFPFFVPAFDPGATIRIFGGHDEIEYALRRQQEKVSFPVPFDLLSATFEFKTLATGENHRIAGLDVELVRQFHDHDSYGFRFERDGKSLVYSTDSEHKAGVDTGEEMFVGFFHDADVVIFDTMYSLAEAVSMKEDWGHSSNIVAVDLCHRAGVRRLVMFHHEPVNDDEAIRQIHLETIRYEELMRSESPLEVLCAFDGFELEL